MATSRCPGPAGGARIRARGMPLPAPPHHAKPTCSRPTGRRRGIRRGAHRPPARAGRLRRRGRQSGGRGRPGSARWTGATDSRHSGGAPARRERRIRRHLAAANGARSRAVRHGRGRRGARRPPGLLRRHLGRRLLPRLRGLGGRRAGERKDGGAAPEGLRRHSRGGAAAGHTGTDRGGRRLALHRRARHGPRANHGGGGAVLRGHVHAAPGRGGGCPARGETLAHLPRRAPRPPCCGLRRRAGSRRHCLAGATYIRSSICRYVASGMSPSSARLASTPAGSAMG